MFKQFLSPYLEPLTLRKNCQIFTQGEVDENFYLVERGLLKAYYVTEDGKEFIKSFIKEGDIIGSLSSCMQGKPCTFSLDALEDTELQRFPFKKFTDLINTNPALASHVVGFLANLALKKEVREYEFLCLSAEERYQSLLEKTPDIAERVSLGDIAKFLGITQVALSRIRKNIR